MIRMEPTDLQAQQRERDVDPSDSDGCDHEVDVIGAEGESDDEIVDAQCPTDQNQVFDVQFRAHAGPLIAE